MGKSLGKRRRFDMKPLSTKLSTPSHRRRPVRKGIAAIWVILLVPSLVIALCLVVEISNLLIARAEL